MVTVHCGFSNENVCAAEQLSVSVQIYLELILNQMDWIKCCCVKPFSNFTATSTLRIKCEFPESERALFPAAKIIVVLLR